MMLDAGLWHTFSNALYTAVAPAQVRPEQCTAEPGEWQLVPFSATYDGYLCQ